MNRQALHDAAVGAALLITLLGSLLGAEAACQWIGATDPALEQAQLSEGR